MSTAKTPPSATRRIEQALEHVKALCDYAYEQGFHELGYDPVVELREALEGYRYAEIEHDNLGCRVAKTGIYAPPSQSRPMVPVSDAVSTAEEGSTSPCRGAAPLLGSVDWHEPVAHPNTASSTRPRVSDGRALTKEQALEAYTDGYYGTACPVSGSDGDPHLAGVLSVVDAVMQTYSMHVLVEVDEYDRLKALDTASAILPIEQLLGLLRVAKCPACDGSGGIPYQVGDQEWEQQQCQWCDERATILGRTDSASEK